jgi:hypothetical protein
MKVFYYIITKISIVDGEIVRTPIGYTDSYEDSETFRGNRGESFEKWVQNHSSDLENGIKDVKSYFNTKSKSHVLNTKTNYIPDGLPLLTDFLDLE